jgi:hypothetical protein
MEESYFRVLDLIPEEMVREWSLHLPLEQLIPSNGRRVYRDIFEEESGQNNTIGEEIWSSVVDYLPTCYLDNPLIGRSHRVRFIRDTVSDDPVPFPKHLDEVESPYPQEKFSHYEVTAQLTILIYLNKGFVGGRALFYLNDTEPREVIPAPGRVVIFDRRILHCAEPLLSSASASSCRDKLLVKCCALYGRERLPADRTPVADPASAIRSLIQTFTESKDADAKVGTYFSKPSIHSFTHRLEACCCEDL